MFIAPQSQCIPKPPRGGITRAGCPTFPFGCLKPLPCRNDGAWSVSQSPFTNVIPILGPSHSALPQHQRCASTPAQAIGLGIRSKIPPSTESATQSAPPRTISPRFSSPVLSAFFFQMARAKSTMRCNRRPSCRIAQESNLHDTRED